jgi:hypothetical protein
METLHDDCGSCKDEIFNLYIDSIDKNIWLIENLSIFLYSVRNLGFTKVQSNLVAESILEKYKKYKIFTGDKEAAFKVLDEFVKRGINVSIIKKDKDIYK